MNHRILAGVVLASGAALAATTGTGTPAAAHPFGPPTVARVAVDGSRVDLSWQPAEDDWVALGQSLGAFEDPTTGPVATQLTGEQKLQGSTAVRDYLRERITVRQDGQPCRAELKPLDGLLAQGARLTFDCPAPVRTLDITLTALTDLNQAYRTVLRAESATPAESLYTATAGTHQVDFSRAGGGLAPAVGLAVGVTAAGGLGALVVVLSRRRTRSAA
ncbi:hypothetical protein C1I95_13060 [Micromonospora craterilacus]|uniref:Uncharacterized protein n=1 Tax=Micromonospora craterilacus TaxID=1655439 RepID=A0A2W2EPL3_9ACTN|nr:hypothetical protein [Micromonospora craterilacus]PZG18699.1 hypothetical protein C1I95_13060 [Micromonospora craterilacus]